MRRFFATTLFFFAWMSVAFAQSSEPDQKALFVSFINSAGYKSYLERIFNLGEPTTLKAECPSLGILEWNKIMMVEQPTFVRSGANYQITSGAWVGMAVMERCGSRVTRRALLKAVPGSNVLQPTFLLPGDFRGNLKLEADAMRIVLPGLMGAAKCTAKSEFLNVRSHGPSTPQGWSETWTAAACGRRVDAEVTYSPISCGMNVTAGKWKVY